MRNRPILIVLAAAAALAGCVSSPSRMTDLFHGGFDTWVDAELGPYLAQQLAGNPRLKQGPVLLVKLDAADIEPRIDHLTDDARRRLFDRLIETPGVNLAWRPAARPWQHHRRLAELDCGINDQPAVYVGLDIHPAANGEYRAAVRALDLRENSWVSGFGSTWSGRLTEAQVAALSTAQPDSYLRGLRPLPFEADQPDLAASYLAHNLSCLLAQTAAERLRVYVAEPDNKAANDFRGIVSLVRRYINQFQEVEVVGDAAKADALVDSELVQIDGDLWQAWLGLRLQGGAQQRVSGADTPAYLRLTQTSATNAVSPAPAPLSPAAAGLIDAFNAIVPPTQSLCRDDDPWSAGARTLEVGAVLPSGGCFGVEATVAAGSDAYLIAAESEGGWSRLVPSTCFGDEYSAPSRATVGGVFRFPRRSVIETEGRGGAERLYLVAARGEVRAQLARILRNVPVNCGSSRSSREDPTPAVRRLAIEYPGAVEMRQLEIFHER